MKIRTAAILGLGAVGAYIYWGLSAKEDIDLCVIAEGERKERLEKNGIQINDETVFPKVKTPEEAKGVDILIVSTKYNGLRDSLDAIEKAAGENTVVMSLLNGVDSEEIIAERIGEERILYSFMKIASRRVGSSIKFNPEKTLGLIYGEADQNRDRERVEAVNELFEGSLVKYRESDTILSEIWTKFRLNVAKNQPQAIINCGLGAYSDSEHVKFMQRKLEEEVEAVAAAKGIELTIGKGGSISGIPKNTRYSTLQDLDAKRHTEVDMFAGAVVRMGEKLGIPTPYNEMVYHIIKALEEKNDGLFDYENSNEITPI